MSNKRRLRATCMALVAVLALQGLAEKAAADSKLPKHTGFDLSLKDGQVKHGPRADGHGPIGVMGEHRHHKGELMLSFRYMRMWMEGNLIGEDNVSPETIATTVPNRFFGRPGQPRTLRVVPTEMSMDMYMFGGMYGITDRVTLMGMVPYIEKEMDHVTFRGPVGTVRRGVFTTESEGIGDVSTAAIVGLLDRERPDGNAHVNLILGLSAPTGSVRERDDVLTPTGARPTQRLPYAMQIGSGTWDFLPGIVYTDRRGDISWGAQYRGTIRIGDNDESYAFGDVHLGTAWMQYQWQPWVSTSVRVAGRTQDDISGIDLAIVAPVQTADPDNYGGERVDLLFGVNLVGQRGATCGHRLAAEFGVPIYQDLNGPQMETDWVLTIGWQKALGDC
ncbi:MAG: hypothetical protein ACR2PO_07665 [Methyloligellaceae bacterium]